jgi:hypothetical protein
MLSDAATEISQSDRMNRGIGRAIAINVCSCPSLSRSTIWAATAGGRMGGSMY